MTEAAPSREPPIARRLQDLIAVLPAGALVVTWALTEAGARGLFQADVVGLALVTSLGAFGRVAGWRPLVRLVAAALLLTVGHGVVAGALDGALALGCVALGIGVAAAGLATLGRAVGAAASSSAVIATAVLVTAMLGLSWADPVGDELPLGKRYAFKQAVLHLDAATAVAYDAAKLDRFHDASVYSRVKLASGAVAPPEAIPTGLFWLVVGVLALLIARFLPRVRVSEEPAP